MIRERKVNLPGICSSRDFRKTKLNEGSVITSNDRYLGVSKAKGHATFRPFANLKRMNKKLAFAKH